MTVYKLTVNLDATLAVQNKNGSYNYFKPSVGAEFTTDEIDDPKILNQKFEDLFNGAVGPNFSSIVTQLVLNNPDANETSEVENNCMCTNDNCDCKPLEISEKPESSIVHYDSATLLPTEIDLNGVPVGSIGVDEETGRQFRSEGTVLKSQPREEWE